MFEESNIEQRWKCSSASEKVPLIDSILNESLRLQSASKGKPAEDPAHSELDHFFTLANLQYSEWIHHANPCINNGALQLLEIDLSSRKALTFDIPEVISNMLQCSLARKETKALAMPILLQLSGSHKKEFIQGVTLALNSKGQKGLLDTLRFIPTITMKDNQDIIEQIRSYIFILASEAAGITIRQEALNVIKNIASEIGIPFIQSDLHLLKESQRIQLAKVLKAPDLATKEIDAIEKRKAETLKLMKEIRSSNPTPEAIAYKEYRESIVSMVVDISKKRTNFNENESEMDLIRRKEQIRKQRIDFLNSILSPTDKLREARSKEQVYIVKEIHTMFKHKTISQEHIVDLSWNFEQYLKFNNPLCAKLILELIQMYISLHPFKAQLDISFEDQAFGVFYQVIKNLSINNVSMMEPSVAFAKFLINYGKFNERIIAAFLTAMEHKSQKVQRQALSLFQRSIINENMMELPGIKAVLQRIVVLASIVPVKMDSSKVHQSEELIRFALEVLVEVAEKIHERIFEFSDKLSKYSNLQFQELTKKLFSSKIEISHLETEVIISDAVSQDLALFKSQLSQRFIPQEKELTEAILSKLKDSSSSAVRATYFQGLLEFLQTDLKYLVINVMRIITNLVEEWTEEEIKVLFEKVFVNVIYEIKAHTMALMIRLFNQRVDKRDSYEFVTKNINMKIFEDRAFDFLTRLMEKLFIEDQDMQKLKFLSAQAIDSIQDPSNTTKKATLIDFLAKIQFLKGTEFIQEVVTAQIPDEKIRVAALKQISSSFQKLQFFEKARLARLNQAEDDYDEEEEDQRRKENEKKQLQNNSQSVPKQMTILDNDDDDEV